MIKITSRLPLRPFSIIIALLIAGCTTIRDNGTTINRLAETLSSRSEVLKTRDFYLQTLQSFARQNQTLRVYIEGDGHSWASRRRPSVDPTPHNLMLTELMRRDVYPDRAYLARPCQFVWSEHCSIPVWTSLRYSQPMVDALNEALDLLKAKGPYERLELIGFSGGGALALVLAARRDDIVAVRTIAGNLEPHFVNRLHNVSPMPDSLTPVDFLQKLVTIPQLHFIGNKDLVITPAVYDYYQSFFSQKNCLSRHVNPDASHNAGWEQAWPELLRIPVICH